jgi:hypothetical protein
MIDNDQVIATQRQSWEQEQKLYNRETANGTNENRQRYWDQTTQQRLDESQRVRAGVEGANFAIRVFNPGCSVRFFVISLA